MGNGNNVKLNIDKTNTGWSISMTDRTLVKWGFGMFFKFLGKWIFVGFGAAIGVKVAEYILTK